MEYQDLFDGVQIENVTNNDRPPFCVIDNSGFKKIVNYLLLLFRLSTQV